MRRHPLVTALVPCLIAACAPESGSEAGMPQGSGAGAPGEVLFSESPAMWFEAYFAWLEVSPDGARAVFDYRRLIDLRTGEELEMPGGLDRVFRARFDTDGSLMVAGILGGEQGWYRPEAEGAEPGRARRDETLPPRFVLEPSPDGTRFAYWLDDEPRTLLVRARAEPGSPAPTPRAIPVTARLAGLAWMPDGASILAYTMDGAGVGALHRVDLTTGSSTPVAEGLDGSSSGAHVAVSDDGRSAFLGLAGPDAPEPEARHRPGGDRDLDVWEVDLESGERRPVVEAPGEQMAPSIAAGALYWVSIDTRSEVALLRMPEGAASGPEGLTATGPPQVVASGVQLGSWRPDSRALGMTTGEWRLADWALNLDGGVIEIDESGRPVGAVQPIITGYHEDFSPFWSPDGRWIAYHSHRSDAPVAGYSSEGSSDDIYLRRADAPDSEEVRLTDFGWEVGNPDWSPDGRRLLMDSWEQGGGSSAWIVEIDPATGAFVGRTRVGRPQGATGFPASGSWSPLGDEIAINYTGPEGTELWVSAPDGSGARRLTAWEGGRYGGLDWTADGTAIVYAAPTGGRYRLHAIARDGGEPWLLAEDDLNLMHPQVSPDGRWVAVTRLEHRRRILRSVR